MMTTQAGITPIPLQRTQSQFQKRVQESIAGYMFMLPAMLIFVVFLIIPIGFALFISLTDWNGITPLGQQAQTATGTVEFTNQTDQAIVIPVGSIVRGLSEREVVTFTMADEFTIEAGESITTNLTLDDPNQASVLKGLNNLQTVVPRNLRNIFEVTNPIADDLGGYAVTITNVSDEVAITPVEGLTISTVGNLSIEFITTQEVTLPAGAGAIAEIPVTVRDDSLGRAGNLARGTVTIPPTELAESVTINNPNRMDGGLNQDFNMVGMSNYNALLLQPGVAQRDFFISVKNTVYFVLGVVPVQTILALLLAVIVNQKWLKGKGFFRTAFYFPSITSSVVISIIFMWMFTRGGLVNMLIGTIFPNYESVTWLNDPNGVIHNFLGVLGITKNTVGGWADTSIAGLTAWEWLSGPSVTMMTIMILNTWTTIGTMMVIFLAALQNIPSSVYEAAAIDGATSWQTFRRITVPLLAPTLFFVVTLGLIGTFQVFDQIYVISSGGPAKTTLTIAYIVYQNGFNNSQMGLAATTALVLFGIIFVFTMIQRMFTTEKVND
jgi:multiple sugar transport system permease protein